MNPYKFVAFFAFLSIAACLDGQNTIPVAKAIKTGGKAFIKKRTAAPCAHIRFDTLVIDFGTVKEDAVVERKFTFTNTGAAPLVILEARGSCGCTVPTVPADPIEAGKKGVILVKYAAKNKVGPQQPEITVFTNGFPKIVKLRLQGWVEQIPGGVK